MLRRIVILLAALPLFSGATPFCAAQSIGPGGGGTVVEEKWCCCGGCCGWTTDCRTIPGCDTC